jgi:hypothetical protein
MALFDFLKNKKEENKFVGRHQQLCSVKKFLGEEIPVLELQMATNKDNSEREEIIKKLQKEEEYINSDMFTNYFDVESVNKGVRDLIDEGYKICVLTNDPLLENRCLKLFDDTHKYLEKFLRKEDNLKGEELAGLSNKIKSFFTLGSIVEYIRLGGLLKDSSDEQRAWIIMNSLFYPNELVKGASSILPPEPAEKEAEKLKDFADKLLKEKKISENDLQKIDKEIREGLLLGKENYKQSV